LALTAVLEGGNFPVIIRPVDSHAGHGLMKIDTPEAIAEYLRSMPEREFYISRFVDYRAADGLFRKYRVVLIDGRPYAGHMGISDDWMIHYLNAGMAESAEKRAEEECFMRTFDEDFASRHADALAAISERVGLDYLVIDCGETTDGKLLVFELDSGAIVHSMDPVDLFPYKRGPMQKVFKAFRDMLSARIKMQALG
jgi:glutathione synthase/RimK-type ligase-like ATP-grasp enzyme